MANEATTPTQAVTGIAPRPPRFLSELDTLIRARYPLLWLVSSEERRCDGILESLANNHGKSLFTWSATRGLKRGGRSNTPPFENSHDPLVALPLLEKLGEPALVVMKDLHPYLQEPRVVRALREAAQALKGSYSTLVVLSPLLVIPPELEKEITVLDVPLPGYRDLVGLLREIVGVLRQQQRVVVDLNKDQADQLVKAALGLTLSEAENAFAKAVADDLRLDANDIRLVLEEKRQVIRKSGLLEYHPIEESLGDVGGLDALKGWLASRAAAFGEPARRFGLPEPKGLLLLGIQGCGKSLTAKAIASQWNLPLLRLDMGRIFSGLIGSSEENLRRAIRVAESAAPAVLWIDELEKGLAGGAASGEVDAGVSARVLGTFLTWLQEKQAPVFVVATANRIDKLPPELLRKGRFDEIFFVDLPDRAEREAILRIHLARRQRDPATFDTAALAGLAEGFSGAELEQAVISGLYAAFGEGKQLESAHVAGAIHETYPLSRTLHEEVEGMRRWAAQRARRASSVVP